MSTTKISAGLLLYRLPLQFFLVHPGGPFFKNRDNVWGIPKGERHDEEDLLACAQREFFEETGIDSGVATLPRMTELGFVEYGGKRVYCWAFQKNISDEELKKVFKSNKVRLPAGRQGWPENDRGEFFDLETAQSKILPGQRPLLEKISLSIRI